MTSKGICIRHKAQKPVGTGRYFTGQKRCQICEVILKMGEPTGLLPFETLKISMIILFISWFSPYVSYINSASECVGICCSFNNIIIYRFTSRTFGHL